MKRLSGSWGGSPLPRRSESGSPARPSKSSLARTTPTKSGTKRAGDAGQKEAVAGSGYVLVGRGEARADGETVPVGNKRSCLADAIWAIMCITGLMSLAGPATACRIGSWLPSSSSAMKCESARARRSAFPMGL